MADRPNMVNKTAFRLKIMDIILNGSDTSGGYYACMPWQKCPNKGYGHMSYTYYIRDFDGTIVPDKGYTAPHRLMFAVVYDLLYLLDPINKYKAVSHVCHTPKCVNPLHLEMEDKKTNDSRTVCKNQGHCTSHEPQCIL